MLIEFDPKPILADGTVVDSIWCGILDERTLPTFPHVASYTDSGYWPSQGYALNNEIISRERAGAVIAELTAMQVKRHQEHPPTEPDLARR